MKYLVAGAMEAARIKKLPRRIIATAILVSVLNFTATYVTAGGRVPYHWYFSPLRCPHLHMRAIRDTFNREPDDREKYRGNPVALDIYAILSPPNPKPVKHRRKVKPCTV